MKMPRRSLRADAAGYSLVELLVALGVTTLIMGATMVGLTDAVRANESVTLITGMNSMLRASMDLMVMDLMQVGAGLPPAHTIGKPSGGQAQPILLPGPPGSAFSSVITEGTLAAVIPGTGRGPTVNGVATDTITVLMADNDLFGIDVKNITPTDVDSVDPIDFEDPPYRVAPGQLIMVFAGSCGSTLVQVTDVLPNGKIKFSASDSMNLNQPQAKEGSLSAMKDCSSATIARIRMISYYIDATTNPNRPRLVRRINNGHPTDFDNDLGTAVGLDIENLQLSYDLVVGNTIRPNVRFTGSDLTAGGICGDPCLPTQVRKVNITLTARSKNGAFTNERVYRNTLTSQVSLRGMAFGNKYVEPE
jgi:hypothetical protein